MGETRLRLPHLPSRRPGARPWLWCCLALRTTPNTMITTSRTQSSAPGLPSALSKFSVLKMLGDDFLLPIECPQCHAVGDRSVGSLKKKRGYYCDSCGRSNGGLAAAAALCTSRAHQ